MAIPLAPMLRKSYWLLVGLGALYVLLLLLLTNPRLQREALYAHKASTAGWFHDLSEPERFGFLNNQIQEARIPTPDGESLYGWHILPLGAYMRHEQEITSTGRLPADSYAQSTAFGFLSDPKTKLIINFHGNAGHVGQGWRTDTYHALTAVDSEHAHVFTFDYRGFGHSTGQPTEEGLINDGVAVVEWFLRHVPAERIALVGNSLGVAVSIATAERLRETKGVELAGLVLVAGFSDLPTLLSTYAILHAIPVFSPLRPYPRIQQYFTDRIVDTWDNVGRLARYVREARGVNVALIHALNDYDIPWAHAETLFEAAANATSAEGLSFAQIEAMKQHRVLKRGGFVDEWKAAGRGDRLKRITKTILRDGGHNRIMTFPHITKAVIEAFRS